LLVIGSVVPLLAFILGLQYLQYRATFAQAGEQALELARSMSLAVEEELAIRTSALEVLTHSIALQNGDLATFWTQADAVVGQQFPGSNIILLREDGQQLLNTILPPGAPLPVRRNLDSLQRMFATGAPAISNLVAGTLGPGGAPGSRPVVTIDVPVKRPDGTIAYALSMNPRLEAFAELIGRQQIPQGWVITIYDAQGTFVGRTLNPEKFVGTLASAGQRQLLLPQHEGVYEGKTREGVPILAAFSHTEPSGWIVSILIPRSQLNGPALAVAARTLAAGVAMLFVGFVLALLLARQILGPIASLRRLATAADRTALLEPAPTGLREADEVAQALRAAEINRRQSEDDERRAREALRQSEEKLQQAQKLDAIGSLTGGMAHDFNNLLGVVIGNLDLARPLVKPIGPADELVGEAIDAALKGAELTRRLLAFARRQPLQPQTVELNNVVGGIINLLRRTLGENIEISLDLAADIWPVVVDPAQLEASLTNLATNARDAMSKGGRLMISTANRHLDADYAGAYPDVTPGDFAMIEVSDTGAGMEPAVMAQIFEPFYTTKERGQGTGLGLSMVFGFMKQSGGHINVYSEPGSGTTFRLYLPRTARDAEAPKAAAIASMPKGGGETVLVVEDNTALRRVVVRQLEGLGYQVIEADTAASGLAVLESREVDIVFSDIVMPGGMDGFELARTVIDRWPATRVVLTSGFPEPQLNGNLGSRVLSVRLLSKPYRKEDLADALHEALQKRDA
jgi:signal transduction histidine kinase/ActR/RegA family two-component response regulator